MTTSTINATSSPPSSSQPTEQVDLLRWIGILMAIVGIGISLYLSYIKLSDTEVICTSTGVIDCSSVQNSTYATLFGIPIALLGLAGYGAILGIIVLSERIQFFADYGAALLFSITLFGFIYSGFLIYVEAFILEKWCQWCVASALLMTGLFILSSVQLFRSMEEDIEDEDEDFESI